MDANARQYQCRHNQCRHRRSRSDLAEDLPFRRVGGPNLLGLFHVSGGVISSASFIGMFTAMVSTIPPEKYMTAAAANAMAARLRLDTKARATVATNTIGVPKNAGARTMFRTLAFMACMACMAWIRNAWVGGAKTPHGGTYPCMKEAEYRAAQNQRQKCERQ